MSDLDRVRVLGIYYRISINVIIYRTTGYPAPVRSEPVTGYSALEKFQDKIKNADMNKEEEKEGIYKRKS